MERCAAEPACVGYSSTRLLALLHDEMNGGGPLGAQIEDEADRRRGLLWRHDVICRAPLGGAGLKTGKILSSPFTFPLLSSPLLSFPRSARVRACVRARVCACVRVCACGPPPSRSRVLRQVTDLPAHPTNTLFVVCSQGPAQPRSATAATSWARTRS